MPHDVSSGELHRVLRSLTGMDGLLVVLTLLYFFIGHPGFIHPLLYMAAIAAYGALVLALRHPAVLAGYGREKLLVAAAAMVLFITSVLAFAGGDRGPLLNLYLLPIVTAALTLGHGATLFVAALVLAGRVALSHFVAGDDVATLAYALTVVAEAVPVVLVAFLTGTLVTGIENVRERLQAASDLDDVTGLLNLQAFTRLLREEIGRAERLGNHFALVLVDVDGLKAVNERHGHEAGNNALAAVAQALRRSSRSVDLVARYGGDEFLLYLSGAGQAVAKVVANRIRHNVATTTIDVGGNLQRVTVSIGAAVFPVDGRDLRDLMKIADRAVEKDRESRRPLSRNDLPATGTLDG
jgi:diguanylate cyclase (GGDEF)-like protein